MMMLGKDIELLNPQYYENIALIPIKSPKNYIDLMTLEKGFDLGLVEVKECETSDVNTLIVKNHAVTPLLLIDGEEVVGGDQNRIVNSTILIEAESEMKIPVSCTEKGRWAYKSEFTDSDYMANYNTRVNKEYASRGGTSFQSAVWSSIDSLEEEKSFKSETTAMSESYENLNSRHEEIIENFPTVMGQTGVLIIINGEIKGFEMFLNSEIYRQFHKKILKSYLIDCEIKNQTFAVNTDAAHDIITDVFASSFEKRDSFGIEQAFEFENSAGMGCLYTFKNQIIHLSYFKKLDSKIEDETGENIALTSDI